MLSGLSLPHILLLLVIVVLHFGTSRQAISKLMSPAHTNAKTASTQRDARHV